MNEETYEVNNEVTEVNEETKNEYPTRYKEPRYDSYDEDDGGSVIGAVAKIGLGLAALAGAGIGGFVLGKKLKQAENEKTHTRFSKNMGTKKKKTEEPVEEVSEDEEE